MKSFLLKIKDFYKAALAWAKAHMVAAISICAGVVVTVTAAIVIPVSISASKRKHSSEPAGTTESADPGNSSDPQGQPDAGDPPAGETSYTIKWVDYDGTELASTSVKENAMPSYPNALPTRADSGYKYYTFKEWSPALSVATGNTTYTATYNEIDAEMTESFNGIASILSNNLPSFTLTFTDENETSTLYFKSWNNYAVEIEDVSYEVYNIKGTAGNHYAIYRGTGDDRNNLDWCLYETRDSLLITQSLTLDKGHGFYADYFWASLYDSKYAEYTYNSTTHQYDRSVTYKGNSETFSVKVENGALKQFSMTRSGSTALVQTFSNVGNTNLPDKGFNAYLTKINNVTMSTLLRKSRTKPSMFNNVSFMYSASTTEGELDAKSVDDKYVRVDSKSSSNETYIIYDDYWNDDYYLRKFEAKSNYVNVPSQGAYAFTGNSSTYWDHYEYASKGYYESLIFETFVRLNETDPDDDWKIGNGEFCCNFEYSEDYKGDELYSELTVNIYFVTDSAGNPIFQKVLIEHYNYNYDITDSITIYDFDYGSNNFYNSVSILS